MTQVNSQNSIALIIGVGGGLSASLARLLHARGYQIALAARDTKKLKTLASECDASVHTCDASKPEDMDQLFAQINELGKPLRVAVYNPSARVRGPITDLDPHEVQAAIQITAYGAFLMGRLAARTMLSQEPANNCRGTILFTGASAGVKGFKQSATFAMGKFAQRGLSESMSRELHPQGVHVSWINIDGGIRSAERPGPADSPDAMLDPDAIARTYLDLINQDRSAWSHEIAVRPWVESF